MGIYLYPKIVYGFTCESHQIHLSSDLLEELEINCFAGEMNKGYALSIIYGLKCDFTDGVCTISDEDKKTVEVALKKLQSDSTYKFYGCFYQYVISGDFEYIGNEVSTITPQ